MSGQKKKLTYSMYHFENCFWVFVSFLVAKIEFSNAYDFFPKQTIDRYFKEEETAGAKRGESNSVQHFVICSAI